MDKGVAKLGVAIAVALAAKIEEPPVGVELHAFAYDPATGWCAVCRRPDRNPIHVLPETSRA